MAADQSNPSWFIVTWQVWYTNVFCFLLKKMCIVFVCFFSLKDCLAANVTMFTPSLGLSTLPVSPPEDKTWMMIQHNNTELTRVQSSAERNQHFAYFDYSSEEEQLVAVISQSEHCEQELSYHCRKSRLSNTLGKLLCVKFINFLT